MTYAEALQIAQAKSGAAFDGSMCLSGVAANDWGWIVEFEPAGYMETADTAELWDGNLPIVVFKSGAIWELPDQLKVPQFIIEWHKHERGEKSQWMELLISRYGTISKTPTD